MMAPRLAVLIDADNASPRIATDLFTAIAKLGEANIRRIYGDFTGTQLKSWVDILPLHAIQSHHSPANVAGKNATDIALVIDAMDLLHSGQVDAFCLVSSDSDFTRLAVRMREQGLPVFGFGQKDKTPEAFVKACHSFAFTDKFGKVKPGAKPITAPKTPQPADAVAKLRKAYDGVETKPGGWVNLSVLGKQLAQIAPNFKPNQFGSASLSKLIEQSGAFDTRKTTTGGVEVKLK